MQRYEYKVIPAPDRGQKAKGVKTPQDRFALAVETAMNQLGSDGWEYWRAEALPASERAGLTGSKITERHMLVFRRVLEDTPIPLREIVAEPAPEPTPEEVEEEAPRRFRAPVFTRRLEMAREQRAANLTAPDDGEDPAPETPEDDATFVRRIDSD